MKERDVKEYMLEQAKANGVLARKVVWEGRDGAPDWVLMAKPVNAFLTGRTIWAELKATGEEPEPHQKREHNRLREHGQIVLVLDSVDSVDFAIALLV